MHTFTALLQKFAQKGEKTGWTYIEVPPAITDALKPGQKTSYRVKGTIDSHRIQAVALVPMGYSDGSDGEFIIAVNATMRRSIHKEAGEMVRVNLEVDDAPMPVSADLMACLADDPAALAHFQALPPGHQRYYHNWIESAKTPPTKAKRIMQTVVGLSMGMDYGEMIRYFKNREV